MGPVPVVVVDPGTEVRVPVPGVLIEPRVGPFTDGGLDKSFGFAVGARRVDAGADVPGVESPTLISEEIGDEAGTVVGHDAAQVDVMPREVLGRLAKEKAC